MNPFAVPSIVAFHAPLADRCTALHPRFICHRQHSGSVPSESADFRAPIGSLARESGTLFLRKLLPKNIATGKIFWRVSKSTRFYIAFPFISNKGNFSRNIISSSFKSKPACSISEMISIVLLPKL